MPRASADDDALYLEEGLAPLAGRLCELGHVVEVVDAGGSDRFGNCTVVAERGGVLEAAADHRRGGEALLW
jgi:gamma-glutamyltranspeptidase